MKATKPAEKFPEDAIIPCILTKAKFSMNGDGQRQVRIEFETPMREAYKYIPENMQILYDGMGNSGAIKSDFGVEFLNRMIEIFFDAKKKPTRIIDNTKITNLQFRRKDIESEMKLVFSVTESALYIGHWVVDHFGDPMFLRAIHAQLELWQ